MAAEPARQQDLPRAPSPSSAAPVTVRRVGERGTRRGGAHLSLVPPANEPPPTSGTAEQVKGQATGRVLAGRYALGEEIGRGGMATVAEATDTTLGRTVAVKLLHPHTGRARTFVERFLEMERRVAALSHPHLVTILDAGVEGDTCYVVMERVAGGSLRRLIGRGGAALPVADALRVVCQVADALDYLHRKGIVHGDVTPENVLLDERGDAKLADFGIAQLLPEDRGQDAIAVAAVAPDAGGTVAAGAIRGTAAYLSPEQLEGKGPDARSDVYALGLVAFELLTGRRPFEGEHWAAVAAQRLVREPESPSALRRELPPAAGDVVLRALARDPSQRYTTAAFLHALRTAARGAAPADSLPRPGVEDTTAVVAGGGRGRDTGRATAAAEATTVLVAPPEPHMPHARAARGAGLTGGSWQARPGLEQLRGMGAWARRRVETLPLPAGLRRLDARDRAVLLGTLALVVLLLGTMLARLAVPPPALRVPDVAGQPVGAAREAVRAAGLSTTVVAIPSGSVPVDHVVRQEPAAGAQLRADRPLTVYVSSGPPPVPVPDLGGRRLDDAKRELEAAGLALGKVVEREERRRPWGTVVEQGARPGIGRAPGTAVDVVVAAPPTVSVPRLEGKSLGEAEAELHKQGMVLGEVRQGAAAGRRAGTVVAQEPAAGVRVRQDQPVHLTIAVPNPPK